MDVSRSTGTKELVGCLRPSDHLAQAQHEISHALYYHLFCTCCCSTVFGGLIASDAAQLMLSTLQTPYSSNKYKNVVIYNAAAMWCSTHTSQGCSCKTNWLTVMWLTARKRDPLMLCMMPCMTVWFLCVVSCTAQMGPTPGAFQIYEPCHMNRATLRSQRLFTSVPRPQNTHARVRPADTQKTSVFCHAHCSARHCGLGV